MTYNIGLIGCGGIAGAWISAVAAHEKCQISMTYDLSAEAAAQRAAETGAQSTDDLDVLLGDESIDLVVIGTPTPFHPELVEQAARAGKHIMCEKPMALDLQRCDRMTAMCQQYGVTLAIGHSLRFWGAFLACRQLIAAGVIGIPVSGSIDRMGTANLQKATSAAGDQTDWRSKVANTGGNVLEGFIHELDFSRAIFGEVASVTAQVGGGQEYEGLLSPAIVQAVAGFETGALVTLRTGSTVSLPTRGYWIAGTEGGLRFSEWGGPIEHYRGDFSEKRLVSAKATNAYYLELCDFIQAVESGSEPENSPLNGKKNIALGLGIYYSFETGRRLAYDQGLPVEMPSEYQNTRWW